MIPTSDSDFRATRLCPKGGRDRFAAARWVGAAALLIALIPALTIVAGCSKDETLPTRTRSPLFLFAVDGLEWQVMKPLLEAGKLPVIEGLMRRGTYGYLSSMLPTYSAVIWTSIGTGKMPEKHGIHNFVYEELRNGEKEYHYYTSGHRRTKAFWNILGDYGLVTDCIGWWITYPAEPIRGIMVSQTNTTGVLRNPQVALWKGTLLKGVEGQVYPPERQNRVMALLEEVDGNLGEITEGLFGRPTHPPDEFTERWWDQTMWAFRADATYVRIARDILETGPPFDVFALYLGGTDVAAHRFWRYAYPEQFAHPPNGEQIEDYGRIIEDNYTYVDRTIGELLAMVPEAGVLIVSDHGMHAVNTDGVLRKDDPPLQTASAHHMDAPPGVIVAAGGPFLSSPSTWASPGEFDLSTLPTLGSVLDITPTILAIKGIPIGEDMDGAPLRGIIDLETLKGSGIRYLPTHDSQEWLATQGTRMRRAIDENERLEQLRSLGYIK